MPATGYANPQLLVTRPRCTSGFLSGFPSGPGRPVRSSSI